MTEAIFYLAIVAIWAGVLLPRWLRPSPRVKEGIKRAGVSQPTLEEKLDRLTHTMRRSALLVEQVSAELEARAVTARQLKQAAEDAEVLAAQNKEQADAVRRLVRSEMTEEMLNAQHGIFRDSLKIAVGSFVAGIAGTVAVTLLVH